MKSIKTIAIASVAFLILVLAVAYLTGPRQSPSTSNNDQTSLTPDQQQRVDDRLNQCFNTGDC